MRPRLSALARKSLADIRRRRGRSVLVVSAIVIGVGALSCVDVAERTLSADYGFTLAGTGPHPDLTIIVDKVTPGLMSGVSQVSGVTSAQRSDVAGTQWAVRRAPGHVDFTIVAHPDPARVASAPFQLLSGGYPGPAQIVMEYGDSALQHVSVGDPVTVDTASGTAVLRVSGIARTRGQNPAVSGTSIGYMSSAGLSALPMHTYVAGQPTRQPMETHNLDFTLRSPASWRGTADSIRARIRAEGATVLSVVPPQEGASLQGVQNVFTLVWVLIGVAVLLAALLLANTVAALVADEVGVIGTMKAVGATRWRVMRGYLTTVLLYGVIATPVGLALGVLAGARLSASMAASIPLATGPFRVAGSTIALGVAVGIGIPLLAALFPLWLGTRVTVRQALSAWGVASVEAERTGGVTRLLAGRLGWVPQTVWLGVRGLFRRPWRAVLSVSTVAVAAVCFLVAQTLVASVGSSVASVWGNFSGDVEVYATGSLSQLRSTLAPVPGIARMERVGWYGAPTPWGKASVWGVEPDSRVFRPRVTAGRWFTAADRDVVVLSDAMAARSHVRVGASFPVARPGGGDTVSMTVIGTLRQSVDDLSQVGSVVMPVNEVYEREGANPAALGGFTNRVLIVARDRSASGVDRLARAIDSAGRGATAARGEGPIGEVFLFHDEVVRHQRDFIPLYDLLYAMSVIVASVGILGLADALAASVVERRREIGLMRALGAVGRRVGSVFVVEGLALSIVAWLAAVAMGIPLAYLFVGLFQRTVLPVEFHFNPVAFPVMLAVTVIIATLAALAPALRASSLRAVDLLRHE